MELLSMTRVGIRMSPLGNLNQMVASKGGWVQSTNKVEHDDFEIVRSIWQSGNKYLNCVHVLLVKYKTSHWFHEIFCQVDSFIHLMNSN